MPDGEMVVESIGMGSKDMDKNPADFSPSTAGVIAP
jgi:hypothetical protein